MSLKRLLIITAILTLGIFIFSHSIQAQDCGSKEACKDLIAEYEQKLAQIKQQKDTLASQIEFMDTQITLTVVRIQQTESKIIETEEEIENLGSKIEGLDTSLDYVGKVLINKIVENYKQRETPILAAFLDSDNAGTFYNRYQYARVAQENDRRLAFQVQQAKLNFEEQKDLRQKKIIELEELQAALDQQKADLDNQKISKQTLLKQTQNDETTYQSLLASVKAEYAAIQGIIAGGGTETEIKEVRKGDVIGSVISGQSCNSTGSHLHFTVLEGGGVVNPFSKLADIAHTDYTGGDVWSPSGSWSWPIDGPVQFHQGFGVTQCVQYGICGRIYSSHNGIDVYGSSALIYAVADGTLYRGSYSVGCTLPYSKVKHRDSNIETLYLHTFTQS